MQEKILELSREHKQVKGLANQIANLVGGRVMGRQLTAHAAHHTSSPVSSHSLLSAVC